MISSSMQSYLLTVAKNDIQHFITSWQTLTRRLRIQTRRRPIAFLCSCLRYGASYRIVGFQYILFYIIIITHFDSQCSVDSAVIDLVYIRFIITIALVLFGACSGGGGCIPPFLQNLFSFLWNYYMHKVQLIHKTRDSFGLQQKFSA